MNACRVCRESVLVEDEGAEDACWWGDAKNKVVACPTEMRPREHTRRREPALPRCIRRNMPEGEDLTHLPTSLSSCLDPSSRFSPVTLLFPSLMLEAHAGGTCKPTHVQHEARTVGIMCGRRHMKTEARVARSMCSRRHVWDEARS